MTLKIETDESLEQLEQLEGKILHAVELLQSARAQKEVLERDNQQLQRRVAEQEHLIRQLQESLNRLEKDRETVKTRVQKILDQVDTLTRSATDAG